MEQHKDRLHGDVLLLPRFSHSLLVALLLLWFSAVATWLLTSSYARKETVSGWLEPASGVTRVYPQGNGIIKQLLVEEGDTVTKGQPLMVVNGDRVLADGSALEEQLLDEYQQQRDSLSEQIERSRQLFERRLADTRKALESARQDLELIEEQAATLKQRLTMATQRERRYHSLLIKQHISDEEYSDTKASVLAVKSELQALARNRLQQTSEVARLENELSQLPLRQADRIDQIKARLSDIARQIAQLHGDRAHVIKAPRAGIVNNLQARLGQQARPGLGRPLLTLVPEGAHLTAELLLPVRAAGFVTRGQAVDIRYDAFPYQKFGLYAGDIKRVSKSLLLPEELSNVPAQAREPVYRVEVALHESEVIAFGHPTPLKPGMTLSADIKLDDRSLVEWLLEPLYSLKGRI